MPCVWKDRRDRLRRRAVGLLVAAEREVDVAGGDEPDREQVLDGLEDDDERTLVVERSAPVHRAVGDASLERRVRPRVALVDGYDVVVRHQHERAIGCRPPPVQWKSRPKSVWRSSSRCAWTSGYSSAMRATKSSNGCVPAPVELGRHGRQLDHLRESLGDPGARSVTARYPGGGSGRLGGHAGFSGRRSAPRRPP